MKKTIMKTTVLAAIASLTMNGYVFAHHPAAGIVDEETYAMIDGNVSDMHVLNIDAMLEDGDLMASTSQGMDGGSPTMAAGEGANASMTATQAASQMTTAPGPGSNNANRGSAGR